MMCKHYVPIVTSTALSVKEFFSLFRLQDISLVFKTHSKSGIQEWMFAVLE